MRARAIRTRRPGRVSSSSAVAVVAVVPAPPSTDVLRSGERRRSRRRRRRRRDVRRDRFPCSLIPPSPARKKPPPPVADSRYRQRALIPIRDGEPPLLRRLASDVGPIEGYGIEFRFRDPSPSLRLVGTVDDDDAEDEDRRGDGTATTTTTATATATTTTTTAFDRSTIVFDRYHFHRGSMTFRGTVEFANRAIRGGDLDDDDDDDDSHRRYDALDCTLNFSDDGRYVRCGELRWRYAAEAAVAAVAAAATPPDGTRGVQRRDIDDDHDDGEVVVGEDGRPRSTPAPDAPRRRADVGRSDAARTTTTSTTTTTPVVDGGGGGGGGAPGVGGAIGRTSLSGGGDSPSSPGGDSHRPGPSIRRRPTSSGPVERWRSVDIEVGALVYRRCDGRRPPGNGRSSLSSSSLGPRYRSDTVWGNTFCQGFCVGMASYHFPGGVDDEDGDIGGDDGLRAYISYESPRTEMWPPLDNGETVPSRVEFRDVRWEGDTRTFRGDICWELDYGTTWMNESKWSYEMKFDPTFAFVESGTVVRSTGESPHRFGVDLIYINAALEAPLREALHRGARTPGSYLDIVRRWRDANASSATLEMLGEVAMNVMDERESMIDFNL
jgi:hypothetical protein